MFLGYDAGLVPENGQGSETCTEVGFVSLLITIFAFSVELS